MSLSIIKYPSGGGGGGGSVNGAENGLHLNSVNVRLGGSLLEATTVTGDTTTETVTFSGVTSNVASASAPSIANSFFKVQSTYDLSAPDPQFGVSLGVTAPADGASNAALLTSGGDWGIIVDGIGTQSVGVLVQNNAGIGIQVAGTGASQGILVNGSSIGIQTSGNGNFALKAVNGSFTTIYSETDETIGHYTFQGTKIGNLNVGTIETLMLLDRNTNAIVPANSAVSLDICAPQVGNTGLKTVRLVSRNANQANNTSKFEIWALNAGVETQVFTIDALLNGRIGIGSTITSPTARLHLPAGAAGAQSAPLKFTSGSLNTTAEAGAVEFLTDKAYLTITTGAARKEFALADAALTSGRVPYVTTNGRLADSSNFTWNQSFQQFSISRVSDGSYTTLAPGLSTSMQGNTDTNNVIYTLLNDFGDQVTLGNGGSNNGFPATTGRGYLTFTNSVFYITGAEMHFSVPLITIGGDSTATAKLHIAAGSATAATAPIKLTSGTVMTTAETGAIEYNGTNLFFTRTGTTRESIFVGVSGATAPSTTAGTTIVNFYGTSATNFLGTPVSWASVVINGTTYKIPLYT